MKGKQRPWRGESGLTLVELLIVIAIIGTLAAIAAPVIADVTDGARVARAIADIKTLESEIAVFERLNARLPTDLGEIGRGDIRDAWGNPYEYLDFATAGSSSTGRARKDRFLVPLNSTYDLYSKGRDGRSQAPLTASVSRDDIIRASDGGYVGLASSY